MADLQQNFVFLAFLIKKPQKNSLKAKNIDLLYRFTCPIDMDHYASLKLLSITQPTFYEFVF